MKYKTLLIGPLLYLQGCTAPNPKVSTENKIAKVSSIMIPDSTSCDLNFLVQIEKNLENINKPQVDLFLKALKSECKNSVEFVEYSNELLFKIIQKKPEIFLSAFCESEDLDKEYIIIQIENPILDFDIDSIIIGIRKVNYDSHKVGQIIKYLEKAKENQSDN
jgi:hypothetical protein